MLLEKGGGAGWGARVRVRTPHKKPPLWGSSVAELLITRWLSALIKRQWAVRQFRVNMLKNIVAEGIRGLTVAFPNEILVCFHVIQTTNLLHCYKFWNTRVPTWHQFFPQDVTLLKGNKMALVLLQCLYIVKCSILTLVVLNHNQVIPCDNYSSISIFMHFMY